MGFEVPGNHRNKMVQKLLVPIGVLRYLGTMEIKLCKIMGFHRGFEVPGNYRKNSVKTIAFHRGFDVPENHKT